MRRAFPCILAVLALAACQPPAPNLTGTGMDMFAPTSIRLHPLSRLIIPPTPPAPATATAPTTQDSSLKPLLEVRIELTDQFSDPTKSPGTLTLNLYDQPPLTHKGPLLQSWSFSIDQPEENRAHWDRTTRTYLFKLPLSQNPPQRPHLLATVTLTLPNHTQLTDELELPLK